MGNHSPKTGRQKNPDPREKVPNLTVEVCEKLGMTPGHWFQNLQLWELYKGKRKAFDECESHQEAVEKGLIPDDLILSDLLNLDF
jgi:hypothetical protein